MGGGYFQKIFCTFDHAFPKAVKCLRICIEGFKCAIQLVMGNVIYKIKTRQKVAEEYGICVKTLISQLQNSGIFLPPELIYPRTLKIIYETLGIPPNLKTS